MTIGLCTLELYLPGCQSLKEKRRLLRRVKDRLRSRFNIAIAEVDYQELWQRASLTAVSVSGSQEVVDRTFQSLLSEVERIAPGQLVRVETEYL